MIQWCSNPGPIDALLENGIIPFVVCPPTAFAGTLVTETPCLDLVSLGHATDAARQIRWMVEQSTRRVCVCYARVRDVFSFYPKFPIVPAVLRPASKSLVTDWCALRGDQNLGLPGVHILRIG